MSGFLDSKASESRRRCEAAARDLPFDDLLDLSRLSPPPRGLGAFGESFDLIAEIKPRSPSEGPFPDRDAATTAGEYESAGAGMLSVLTEPAAFGGSLDLLRTVRAPSGIPVLAKDFLVDPYQVHQARESGADGVLLIARILPDDSLALMLDTTLQTGMYALVEVFDAADLGRAVSALSGKSNVMLGVNSRDLDTLEVVPDRHERFAGDLPPGVLAVAESGIRDAEEVERVALLGYRAALVGSALMRSSDAAAAVRSMIEAGRRSVVAT
jgi:indole-3-glycerol phosphate synthase